MAALVILFKILPVLMLMALGAILARTRLLHRTLVQDLNKLVYWIGLPALVIHSLHDADFRAGNPLRVCGALWLTTIAGAVLAWAVSVMLRVKPEARGTFVQASFRGNLAYMGIPILVYAYGGAGSPGGGSVVAAAIMVLAPTMIVYNVFSVMVLQLSRHRISLAGLTAGGRELIANPLIWASVIGLSLAAAPVNLPRPVVDCLAELKQICVPLSLLAIGASLVTLEMRKAVVPSLGAGLVKTAALPLLAWIFGRRFALEPEAMRILMIFASSPTAVASYVLAIRLGGDESLASGSIVASTLLSAIPLLVVLAWF